jgi:hypothetical protein
LVPPKLIEVKPSNNSEIEQSVASESEYATLPLYPGEEALDEPAPLVTA